MHHPKHLYATGIITGIFCGIISALTVYSTMVYISAQNLETSNPIVIVVIISAFGGGMIGLIISLIVHQITKPK